MKGDQSSPPSLSQEGWDKLLRLRGFLAFYVLLHHIRNILWPRLSEITSEDTPLRVSSLAVNILGEWGPFAVFAFFVVSGYSIGIAYSQKFKLSKFWKSRIRRLYPALIFSLIFTAGCVFLTKGNLEGESINFISTALMQNGVTIGDEFGSNSPYWSLACEGYYYLFFSIFAIFLNAKSANRFYILLACLYVFSYLFFPAVRSIDCIVFFPIWLFGLHFSKRANKPLRPFASVAALTGLAAFLSAYIIADSKKILSDEISHLIALSAGFCMAPLIMKLSQAKIGFPLRGVREFMGNVSYSLYLVHYPIIMLLDHYLEPHDLIGITASSVAAILLSVAVSTVSYHYFEKPFIRRRAQLVIAN